MNASLFGANTVNGPSPLSVSTSPGSLYRGRQRRQVGVVGRRDGHGVVGHPDERPLPLGGDRRAEWALWLGRPAPPGRVLSGPPLGVVLLVESPPVPAAARLGPATTTPKANMPWRTRTPVGLIVFSSLDSFPGSPCWVQRKGRVTPPSAVRCPAIPPGRDPELPVRCSLPRPLVGVGSPPRPRSSRDRASVS